MVAVMTVIILVAAIPAVAATQVVEVTPVAEAIPAEVDILAAATPAGVEEDAQGSERAE